MPVSKTFKIGYLKSLVSSLLALVLVTGCLHEDSEDCPPENPARQLLYLRVSDDLSRTDISQTEELDDIMVYLYDRSEALIDTIPYTSEMIRNGIPMDLTDRQLQGGYASVWANLGNSVHVDPVAMGQNIEDMEVEMLSNDNRADFFLCPGDMFFGYRKIAFSEVDPSTRADTVWLSRKNSRLHITVKGLPDTVDAANYYFRIGSLYSAYNFEGTPLLVPRNIWEEGIFNSNSDFVSPEPYMMIHNARDHVYSQSSRVLIELYRLAGTRTDDLLASAERDVDGQYIMLEQGKTTNVLIIFDPSTGQVEVHTAITPWGTIYQWTFW